MVLAVLSGGAAAIASAVTPSSGPARLSERQILTVALAAARRMGDAKPTPVQHTEGIRHGQAAYLIAERGHFRPGTDPLSDGPARMGSVLTVVVNAATGEVTDLGVSDRYPNLAALGRVTTDLNTAPSVRLELTPRIAHPIAWVQIVIVNGARPIVRGGCWAWQRLVDGKWQGGLGSCLGYFPIRARSRTTKVLHLAGDFPPGRDRIRFVSRDAGDNAAA